MIFKIGLLQKEPIPEFYEDKDVDQYTMLFNSDYLPQLSLADTLSDFPSKIIASTEKKVFFSDLKNNPKKPFATNKHIHNIIYHKSSIRLYIAREISKKLGISIQGGIDSPSNTNNDTSVMVHNILRDSDLYVNGVRQFDKIKS
ncbi:MAG: hypothetical protein MHPSP_002659, partial [Paramarteilia canceri]